MPSRRYRPSRLPFVAAVQVTSTDTRDQIAAYTEDLTVSGCFVETATPFVEGTNVALQISHNGTFALAEGKVAHSQRGDGMGIRFTFIEPSSMSMLRAWVTEAGE